MPGQQRAKGSGSIRGNPGKSGISWEIRYDGPSDAPGRRKPISETVQGARKEGERVLRERLGAVENGGHAAKQKEAVGQFMTRWLDTYAATNTPLRTQEGYRGNIKLCIAPAIGKTELQKLTIVLSGLVTPPPVQI